MQGVDRLPSRQQGVLYANHASPSMSAASSFQQHDQRRGSNAASTCISSDSASLHSTALSWQATSSKSGTSKDKGSLGLWSRRGSVGPKSLRSIRSKGSTRSGHREGSIASGSDQAFEMTAIPLRGQFQKTRVIENETARQDRAKAEAAMAKWRVR